MRKNLPVTNREVRLEKGQRLITQTTPKGVITEANAAFIEISGYTKNELIGQAHNLIRHPDMPPAIFARMWQNLQAGRAWMGIVKNRCKTGDHYWVDAFVSPLKENGRVVGYESVRREASRAAVARAEKVYRRLQQNKAGVPLWLRYRANATLGALGLPAALGGWLAMAVGTSPLAILAISVASALIGPALRALARRWRLQAEPVDATNDPLSQFIYTGQLSSKGRVEHVQHFHQSQLNTVLTALNQSAADVSNSAGQSNDHARQGAQAMAQQRSEIDNVTTAIHQMSTATAEVARDIALASNATQQSSAHAREGEQTVSKAVDTIHQLGAQVEKTSALVQGLAHDTAAIESLTAMINDIADQTNLLALNAAIEAARAGDAGRGFAVVADEVRNLAQRTQNSTLDINGTIEHLRASTQKVVAITDTSQSLAHNGMASANEIGEIIGNIAEQIGRVEQMVVQVASASEEQSQVAQTVQSSMQAIAHQSEQTAKSADAVAGYNRQLNEQALAQKTLIERFSTGDRP